MNKKTKMTLIMVLIILTGVVIFRLFYVKNVNKSKDNKELETKELSLEKNNPTEYAARRFDPKLVGIDTIDKNIKDISINMSSIELPEQILSLKTGNQEIDNVMISKVLSLLSINNPKKDIDEGDLLLFHDSSSRNYIYINKKKHTIDYQTASGTILEKSSEKNLELIKNSFKKLSLSFIDPVEKVDFQMNYIKYFKNESGYLTPSTKEESEVIRVEGFFVYNGKKLYNSSGLASIVADYGVKGKLLSFKIQNPFLKIEEGESLKALNWEEIKNSTPNNYMLFSIDGSKDYIKNMGAGELGEIVLSEGNLGYIYSPLIETYLPIITLSGISKINSDTVEVRLGLAATKN